jgi:hypothetical protein
VVAVAEDSGSGSRAGITATAPTANASFDQGAKPPGVDLPRWTKTDSKSGLAPPVPEGNELFAVLVPHGQLFHGDTRIRIGMVVAPQTYASVSNPTPVDVNGVAGRLGIVPGAEGEKLAVVWTPASGNQMFVEGTHATADEVLGVARGLVLDGENPAVTLPAGAVPEGLSVVHAGKVVTDPVVQSESTFERDGVRLHVKLDGGGRNAYEADLLGSEHTVTVRGQQAALHTDDGRNFSLRFVDGRWAVEISGGPFVSEQAFFEEVESLTVTPAG